MTNTELIKALQCGGHNMIFYYCDKEDCPYCQYSYYENLHRCNVQELGIDAVDALEAAERRIARLEEDLKMREAEREVMQGTIKICEEAADRYKEQIPKEGKWLDETDGCYFWHGKCSICNYEYNIDSYYADMNYCPNCGARMKKRE